MSANIFNFFSQNRNSAAYKVFIEPYSGDTTVDLGYEDLTKLVKDKLGNINQGYVEMWGENHALINNNKRNIIWSEATIEADLDSEHSLSFSTNSEWQESEISEVIGHFIPSSIGGNIISKAAGAGTKTAVGSIGYQGTVPSFNFNDRKTFMKPNYLTYSLQIKVVDKNNDGAVLKTLTKLAAYSMAQSEPADIKEALKAVQSGINSTMDAIDQPETDPETGKPKSRALTDSIKAGVDTFVKVVNKSIDGSSGFAETILGMTPKLELLSIPVPLKIYVSDYFVHSLAIITSVNYTLSKQVNENGYPMWGVFTLEISSREKTTLDLSRTKKNENYPVSLMRNISFITANMRKDVGIYPHVLRGTS